MSKISVSDHAVLRYLERVGGFEIEALRGNMERRAAETLLPGASSVVIDGHRFVVGSGPEGQVIVTILDKTVRPNRASTRGRAE
jgi:hypothetical protein